MKVTFKKLNGKTILDKHEGTLNSKKTLEQDLIKTIKSAYKRMAKDPNCTAVTITLRKEVKQMYRIYQESTGRYSQDFHTYEDAQRALPIISKLWDADDLYIEESTNPQD